jgi:galactoside O-acetyltransferase
MNDPCFSRDELLRLGLAEVGEQVRVHRSVLLFGCENIHIGSNVRIDAFSLLSAGAEGISIGNNVHLAAGCYLFGTGGRIVFEDFAALSSRGSLYTGTDDYREGYLTGPTVPDAFRKVMTGPVVFRKHALVGASCVILPGVELGEGCSVGAMSLVRRDVASHAIVAGNPLRRIGTRDGARLRELEGLYLGANRGVTAA